MPECCSRRCTLILQLASQLGSTLLAVPSLVDQANYSWLGRCWLASWRILKRSGILKSENFIFQIVHSPIHTPTLSHSRTSIHIYPSTIRLIHPSSPLHLHLLRYPRLILSSHHLSSLLLSFLSTLVIH